MELTGPLHGQVGSAADLGAGDIFFAGTRRMIKKNIYMKLYSHNPFCLDLKKEYVHKKTRL